MSATSITKQSAWICFIACVVVTSDTMSSTPEFQRDSVSDGWITGRPNLTTFVLVKSSRIGRVIYCLRRAFLLYWPSLDTNTNVACLTRGAPNEKMSFMMK